MKTIKLFEKYKCKGFYKRIYDGIYINLDKKELTATAMKNSEIIDEDVFCVEKTLYEYIKKDFQGIVVGTKKIMTEEYLDVIYEDEIDIGVGIIPEKFYVDKRAKKVVECAIVYYANNKKHLVPISDIEEV